MRRLVTGLASLIVVAFSSGCTSTVNVQQEREALLKVDRDWSASTKNADQFLSFFAADATVLAPGMPMVTGAGPIREAWTQMSSAPGFSVEWTPAKAEVSASGDLGYTTGNYKMMSGGVTDTGKYVSTWKKQADGQWKVTNDIFNSDIGTPASTHVAMAAPSIQWGDPPPALPPGAKLAVVSGDPTKPGAFVIRVQFPAGYKIAPHWHPTDENVTVLAGTMGLGMGETWDDTKVQTFPAGSYVVLPANMRHYATAKTAATLQITGTGPFVVNYVNPADDPSKAK